MVYRARGPRFTIAAGDGPDVLRDHRTRHTVQRPRCHPPTEVSHTQAIRPDRVTAAPQNHQMLNERVDVIHELAASSVEDHPTTAGLLRQEVGYVRLDPHGAELLFQIVTAREERASIACASNAPFSKRTGSLRGMRFRA